MKILPIILGTLLLPLSGCSDEPPSKPPRKASVHLVEVTTAVQRKPVVAIKRSGTIEAARVLRLYFQQAGKIEVLPFHEGDEISKGTVLARLDKKLLTAQLRKEKALTRQAKLELDRMRVLQDKSLVSANELLTAETNLDVARSSEAVLSTQLKQASIKAPFDGIITQRLSEPGDVISSNTHFSTLIDPKSLQIKLKVSDRIQAQLRNGTPAKIQIDALGKKVLFGKVSRIHPSLSETDRQALVEVQFDQLPSAARVGQFCRVTLEPDSAARLLIRSDALRLDASGSFVFRIIDGKAARTQVVTGTRIGTDIEIISGLVPGNVIVRKGFLDLRDGTPVKQLNEAAAD